MITTALSQAQNRVAVWTYTLLALSFIPTVLGVMVGPKVPSLVLALILFAFAVGLILWAPSVAKTNPILGCCLFLLFAFVEGASIAPMISKYMATSGGQAAILKSLIATGLIFVSLSLWTWAKGFDAQSWGPYLFVALISLVVVMVLSLFFPSSIMQTLISFVAVLIFSLFIVYDTSEIIHGRELNPVAAAIALYLDALNIFVHLLQLFGSSSDD